MCWTLSVVVVRAHISPTNWSKAIGTPRDILHGIHLRASTFFCSLAETGLVISFNFQAFRYQNTVSRTRIILELTSFLFFSLFSSFSPLLAYKT
jgi:hypothetical protein